VSALEVDLVDPATTFTPHSGDGDGSLIDDIRDDCGYVIRGIDWVCRQLGFDLIGAIFNPIAGDYDTVGAMAANWDVLGAGLGQIGHNYQALAGAAPGVWTGEAATAACGRLSDFAEGFATQAEGAHLIAGAMQDMLAAVKAVVELLADLLSMVDDLVATLLGSALKWLKEIVSGGETVRKIVSLVRRAIDTVRSLEHVVPPLLQACALMASMMKALDAVFRVGDAALSADSGSKVDDIAHAGF
jgi:hypothetical protein